MDQFFDISFCHRECDAKFSFKLTDGQYWTHENEIEYLLHAFLLTLSICNLLIFCPQGFESGKSMDTVFVRITFAASEL